MDKKEITALFRQYYGRMYGMAVSILYDEQESKDVVSDIFERLLVSDTVLQSDTVEHYLLTSVRNSCLKRIAHKLFPWWHLNMDVSGIYLYVPKSYNVKHIWYMDDACVNYFTFRKVGSFTIEGNYFTSTIDANYKSSPIGYVNLGYHRTFLKEALSLGINVFDVFHTLRQKGYQLNPVLNYEFRQKAYSRYSLTLTYSFHNKHKVRSGKIENDNSIKNRL